MSADADDPEVFGSLALCERWGLSRQGLQDLAERHPSLLTPTRISRGDAWSRTQVARFEEAFPEWVAAKPARLARAERLRQARRAREDG